MAGARGCVISLLSDVTYFTLAQNVSPWTTWELAPFSGFFRSPGWMILKQHSHLVLFLVLSWAELSVNPTLSSARLRLPLEPHCWLFPAPTPVPAVPVWAACFSNVCSNQACSVKFSIFLSSLLHFMFVQSLWRPDLCSGIPCPPRFVFYSWCLFSLHQGHLHFKFPYSATHFLWMGCGLEEKHTLCSSIEVFKYRNLSSEVNKFNIILQTIV